MTSKKLERYLEDYQFSDTSLIRKDGDRMWIPNLFCHKGHNLKVTAVTFDDLPAMHIEVEVGEGGPIEDFYLSPIINDSRKDPICPRAPSSRCAARSATRNSDSSCPAPAASEPTAGRST